MKTYLITGGCGFIGTNFINYIFNKYDNEIKIINIDKLTYASNNLHQFDSKYNDKFFDKFFKEDICSRDLYYELKGYEFDCIINFAAETHVDNSIINPNIFLKTNIFGTANLLDLAIALKVKKFIQISTDEVYGSLNECEERFTETSYLNPSSPYSASKLAADALVYSYFKTYNLPINITRCSNNFGKYQFEEKFIPKIIKNIIENKPIPVYGNGLNIRDWIHVDDHCKAIDMIINNGANGEIYNIGGNNERRNIDIVDNICDIMERKGFANCDKLITFVEDRKGHDYRYAVNFSKLNKNLGFVPSINFIENLEKTIDFYIDKFKK